MSTATTPAPHDLLTYEEAAAYLGVTVHAIRHAVSLGNLKSRKFPRDARKYLSRQQLDDYRAGIHRHAAAVTPAPSAQDVVSPEAMAEAVNMAEAINMAALPFLELAEKVAGIAKPMSEAVIASLRAHAQGDANSPKVSAG